MKIKTMMSWAVAMLACQQTRQRIVERPFNLWAPLVFADAINVLFEGIAPAMMGLGEINISFANLGQYVFLLIGIYIVSAVFTYYQEQSMASVSQKLVLSLIRMAYLYFCPKYIYFVPKV